MCTILPCTWCRLSANIEYMSKNLLHTARWKYRTQKSPKIAVCASSHNFVGLYLRDWGMYRQPEKNSLNVNICSTCLQKIANFRLINSWDPFGSLGHHSKFQRLSRLGFVVTALMSLNGGQQNFARYSSVSWAGTLYIHYWGSCP